MEPAAGYSNREYYSGDMRGTYNGARGSLNAGYSYDNNSQRIDYGANGSIVAHADGITLGQTSLTPPCWLKRRAWITSS